MFELLYVNEVEDLERPLGVFPTQEAARLYGRTYAEDIRGVPSHGSLTWEPHEGDLIALLEDSCPGGFPGSLLLRKKVR